jgi:glyoxalase family protein
MPHAILGLHHVTATVDDAQPDLDFCLEGLGLRLVKKTVNFDNHSVYHFYYGNRTGEPGTIWTTFPYRGRGVRVGVKGAGQVTRTSFSVPASSLAGWRDRLTAAGVATAERETAFGEAALHVDDPSGLWMALVASDADPRLPWTGHGVTADAAIRGLHSVTLTVRDRAGTVAFMRELLGARVVDETPRVTRVAVGAGDGAGHVLDVEQSADAPPALNGLGTVHHVALAIGTGEEQQALREDLVRRGLQVTDVRDRCYFTSIYFREPGGVLIEVATTAPGFTVDEDEATLGRALKLPPWEEPHRGAIEAQLAPITYR